MTQNSCLLVVAHGSKAAGSNQHINDFVDHWRARHPERRIALCFIEHADTLLAEGLAEAASTAAHVHVLPLILSAAGHLKDDIPQALQQASQDFPQVSFSSSPALGLRNEVRTLLSQRVQQLRAELAMPDPRSSGLILLGRGSSDAEANAEMSYLARLLYEEQEFELVDVAYTGITWPRLETVVARQVRLGLRHIVIQPVYLFPGVLLERIAVQFARLRQHYPQTSFVLGSHLGDSPEILQLLERRLQDVPHL